MKSQVIKTFVKGGWAKRILTAILFTQIGQVKADVIVTPATNGLGISADLAADSRKTAYTPIGDIVISEQQTNDFAFTGRYWRTMVLTAPAGWEFNPGVGKIFASKLTDFRVTDLKVEAQTMTLRFCVRSTDQLDVLTVSGVEVRAISGIVQPVSAYIYRSAMNPGTAMVSNIVPTRHPMGLGGTNFASLSQKPGTIEKLVFSQKPGASEEGKRLDGMAEVMTVDQFGNFSTEGLPAVQHVTVRLSTNTSALTGQTIMNIGTAGGNGKVVFDDLQITETGMRKLIASSPALSFAVTNDFMVYNDALEAPATGLDADLMCVK